MVPFWAEAGSLEDARGVSHARVREESVCPTDDLLSTHITDTFQENLSREKNILTTFLSKKESQKEK